MSDSEDFLRRWSRRKRRVAEAEDSSPAPTRPEQAAAVDGEKEQDKKEKKIAAADPKNTAPEAAFDLKSLPSIESITATTDIRGFLAPGVPVELMRAALRRAWVADPKIRDFIGIAENQWDFTKSGGVPGSDLLAPSGDIARMVAEIFGEKSPADESPDQAHAAATQSLSATDEKAASAPQAEPATISHRIVNEQTAGVDREAKMKIAAEQKTISERVEQDAAAQQEHETDDAPSSRAKRGHGGALPA